VSTIGSDLRYAIRSLLKSPGLSLAAILSLGLGIGANTTIFTWVQAVLFRPIPVAADPDRILIPAMTSREGRNRSWSYPNYRDFRDRSRLVDITGQDDLTLSIAVDNQAERAWGALVSGNYFDVLGLRPAVGRLFTADDDKTPGGHPVIVLSHAYWQRRFAGDSSIVGRQVSVNNTPMTVIGVAPEGFIGSFLGLASSAWMPMMMQSELTGGNRLEQRGNGWMNALVRLKPGVSRAQAQAEAESIMRQLENEYPDTNGGRRIRLVTTWEAPFGAPTVLAPILGVLSIVVALVLAIACANVANLLLSKAVGRRREVAIRLSMGASRWRVVRQLLTEALVLSTIAGIAGVVMARWTMNVIMAFVPPVDLPIDLGLRMDQTTLLFALAVSMLTGIVFGLAPAIQASNPETVNALKEQAGRGSEARSGRRLRSSLVVAQVAVCLVLLVGATLFLRSLIAAQQLSPGFDPAGVATVSMDFFPSGYTGDRTVAIERRIVDAVEALPGVTSASFANRLALGLSGNSSIGVDVDGYTPQPNEEVVPNYTLVAPRHFETMRIPLREGREFLRSDTKDSPLVVVINETMARRYWPNRKALGGHIRFGRTAEVIGIAADARYSSLSEPPTPQLYFPLAQNNVSTVSLLVRVSGDPARTLNGIRDAIRTLDPNLPLYNVRTLTEHMQTAVFAQRMAADLLGALGILALLLAAIGLYGVIAYAVSQRTQEMGIRLALGASPGALLAMIVGHGMRLTIVGLVIGLSLALAAFGSIGAVRTLLPGISPLDPMTFVAVPLILAVIAALAAWIPARRAGRVDPLTALRYE
jgi:macrolide transport system ATP-binding/permease protein